MLLLLIIKRSGLLAEIRWSVYMSKSPWQKVTEWEITKTEVVNEMEIFITLKKYNTHQSVKKVPTSSSDYLVSRITPQRIYEKWDIPIYFHR